MWILARVHFSTQVCMIWSRTAVPRGATAFFIRPCCRPTKASIVVREESQKSRWSAMATVMVSQLYAFAPQASDRCLCSNRELPTRQGCLELLWRRRVSTLNLNGYSRTCSNLFFLDHILATGRLASIADSECLKFQTTERPFAPGSTPSILICGHCKA